MQQYLKIVGNGQRTMRDFTADEAEAVMELVLSGQASDSQVAVLMAALRIKEESVSELATFTEVMRRYSQRLAEAPPHTVDICVPYDGRSRTPILLAAAAFLAAACGAHIGLHGRIGQTTPPKFGVGVGDVLDALGIPVQHNLAEAGEMLAAYRIAFVDSATFSSKLERFLPVRLDYGMRSFFNTVEKLINPFNAPAAIVGVFHYPVLARVAETAEKLGYAQAIVVQGPEGSIEALTSRRTPIVEFSSTTALHEWTIDPREMHIWEEAPAIVPPLTPSNQADLTLQLLNPSATTSTYERNSTLLTAALILYAADLADSIPAGIRLAEIARTSGAAWELLASLRKERQYA